MSLSFNGNLPCHLRRTRGVRDVRGEKLDDACIGYIYVICSSYPSSNIQDFGRTVSLENSLASVISRRLFASVLLTVRRDPEVTERLQYRHVIFLP